MIEHSIVSKYRTKTVNTVVVVQSKEETSVCLVAGQQIGKGAKVCG